MDTREGVAMKFVLKVTLDPIVCTNVAPTVLEMNPAIDSPEFVMKVVRTTGVVPYVERVYLQTCLLGVLSAEYCRESSLSVWSLLQSSYIVEKSKKEKVKHQ